ncbi:MAG: hypothetical protein ACFFG0_39825 [Candidatus Thorarchaeota archaeon]
MFPNDFDPEIQSIFNNSFFDIKSTDWKNWLEVSSKDEYIELVLKNSGLSSISNIFEKITTDKNSSNLLSIDLYNYISEYDEFEPLIVCHSSGTTNSDMSALKWFHMSKEIVQRYWAPGMQAIFESSGLSSKSSVIIFVPSRLSLDGLKTYESTEYVAMYTSEFSQRLVLAMIKPQSYTFFEYKNSKNLNVISKILSIDDISVISAPASTILGWADINRFQLGLKESFELLKDSPDNGSGDLMQKIKQKGIKKAAKEIQKMLSDKLSRATLIFGISSLLEKDWKLIRHFLNWQRGKERFTNLYVASEIGPFAASIDKDQEVNNIKGNLNVFPLTLPVIESKGKKQMISDSKEKIGNLLISRVNLSKAYFNLDVGDVIKIIDQHALPLIEGRILRSSFQLRYPINISNKISIPSDFSVYAGEYFSFNNFEVYDPRTLLNCLNEKSELSHDSLLLIDYDGMDDNPWRLILRSNKEQKDSKLKNNTELMLKCIKNGSFSNAISNNFIKIQLIDEDPVDFLATRSTMLERVRNGKNPKGILKKWPLYVIRTM